MVNLNARASNKLTLLLKYSKSACAEMAAPCWGKGYCLKERKHPFQFQTKKLGALVSLGRAVMTTPLPVYWPDLEESR
jgi:hypothetical protein